MSEKKEFLQHRKPVTFVDLFAGAGGISEGFMQSAKMTMMQGQEITVKYAWENGKLVSQTMNVMGNDMVMKLKYDEKGYLKAQVMDMGGQEMEIPYTDYKFDSHGNWISRKTQMMGQEREQTRTIEYYE